MKKITQMFFLLSMALGVQAKTPHVIVCTFELYPELPTKKTSSGNTTIQSHWTLNPPQIEGIYGSYFGYLDTTTQAGQLLFPRKHQADVFTVVVAPKIDPIFMIQNTIQTWRVPTESSYSAYTIMKEKDDRTGVFFWNVKETTLPENNALPLNAITLIADPSEIYIPTGISLTHTGPQLQLPTFYVKKNINLGLRALTVLDIRCFFEPISRTFKTQGSEILSKMN